MFSRQKSFLCATSDRWNRTRREICGLEAKAVFAAGTPRRLIVMTFLCNRAQTESECIHSQRILMETSGRMAGPAGSGV
jgi:hypothetical protein